MVSEFFYSDTDDLAHALAEQIAGDLKDALKEFAHATLILPGGSSPRALMQQLAQCDIPWNDVTVSTTDERAVPLDSEESNAGQVRKLLGIAPLWLCDADAWERLKFPATVTVLGMGMDAHIASLFPGSTLQPGRGIVKTQAPNPPYERLSLTLETLLDTRRLILLASDAAKAVLVKDVMVGKHPGTPLESLMRESKEKLEIHAFAV